MSETRLPGGPQGYVARSLTTAVTTEDASMSPVRIRPVGGAAGCLVMILVSVVLSVVLTVLLNALVR